MEKRTNKIISLVLAISLLLSMFTVNMFVSAEDIAIWDGSRTAPTEGAVLHLTRIKLQTAPSLHTLSCPVAEQTPIIS